MEARPCRPARPMPISAVLCLLCVAALWFAPTAHAGFFKMVLCAGNNGAAPYATATNTVSAGNPGGIFEFHNACGGQGGDPPGENAFLRINENQAAGNAGEGAYGDMIWDTPNWVHWKRAGGYTREPNSFNAGWRARFWVIDFANNGIQLLTQGSGLSNTGTQWGLTANFGPHLWPFGGDLDFHRLVFELECVRAEGCERSGFNATDANGFVFILSDDSDSQIGFTETSSPLLSGQWVRGSQNVTYNVSDLGSGLRWERMRIDGAQRWAADHGSECNTSGSQVNGEWARSFQPCPTGGPWGRSVPLDTASLSDGTHVLSVCSQDFGQYQGLEGTGGESCDQRTIRTDNTAPDAPANLEVTSANPARYLQHFAAHWQLPLDAPPAAPQDVSVTPPFTPRSSEGFDLRWHDLTDSGSPIAAVHYEVLDGSGKVAVPAQTVGEERIEAIRDLETPLDAGQYSLRLWLSDAEGNEGAAVRVPLAYDCERTQVNTGAKLDTGLGEKVADNEVVQEGTGSQLRGSLLSAGGGGVSGVPLCVFSRVITDHGREFLGTALTGKGGRYGFAVAPGASRDLSVIYRSDHRELVSDATLETVVHPTFQARSHVVYNKHFARFSGKIPGPDNNRVVIVLQVREGHGWLAFRRYRTRANGRYTLAYRFRRTYSPTRYVMRAQVRQTVGYPYLQGNSRRLGLLVLPHREGPVPG